MRYWWVNQNQTFDQEISGGYLWSPKRNVDGGRNPFYESMREIAPGDLILSFKGTFIQAVGVAQSNCYECPKPVEFGNAGAYWERVGWKVDVHYHILTRQLRPRDHMYALGSLLPEKYSPLQISGRGNQGVYLTELPTMLMATLVNLIGNEAEILMKGNYLSDSPADYHKKPAVGLLEWEEHLRQQLESDKTLQETEKKALIFARRGQGLFKDNVGRIENCCRVTHVDRPEHLRASHIKPWRDSNNQERLDGENGFLLTPTIDHLFDRGFVTFKDNGTLLISPVAHKPSLERMGIATTTLVNVGSFSDGQKRHLDFHRNFVFLESKLS